MHPIIPLLLACFVVAGCSTGAPQARESARTLTAEQARNEATVRAYLGAQDPGAALAYLAPDYRPRLLEWDTLTHPRRSITELTVNDDAAIVVMHEDNDFSRLIDHPGWDGTVTYFFAEDGRIRKSAFTPTPGCNPSWRPYMDAALPWLRENRAGELASVFPDNKLRQDAEGARTWTRILTEWREATGRPAIRD